MKGSTMRMNIRYKRTVAILLTAAILLVTAIQSFAAPLGYANPATAGSEPAKITGTWSTDASGKWHFSSNDGAITKNGWYYLNTTNKATDYNWFCFDASGVMRTGWIPDKDVPGIWYYAGESKDSSEGSLMRGWITDPQDGKKYYLDPTTGIMCHGWQLINNTWYYFGESQYADKGWSLDADGHWIAGTAGKHSYGSLYVNEYTPDKYYVGSNGEWLVNGKPSDDSSYAPPAPVTTKYTVTFDMQGHGTQIATASVADGGKVTKPEEPEDDGYIFAGWYKEASYSNAWYFGTDTVSENTTLYAKWTDVTLEMDNGDTEYTWNVFTITIKGTDIASASYYFFCEDNTQGDATTLSEEKIEKINSDAGLHIDIESRATEETTYTTVLVVSNSAGYSKTIVAKCNTGEVPPP